VVAQVAVVSRMVRVAVWHCITTKPFDIVGGLGWCQQLRIKIMECSGMYIRCVVAAEEEEYNWSPNSGDFVILDVLTRCDSLANYTDSYTKLTWNKTSIA
jgi:hypothetical protein